MHLETNADQISELPSVSYGGRVSLPAVTLPEGIFVSPPPHVFGSKKPGDPRLVISHIVNRNFKSYAGKQVLGPFHNSFSCIIGPNGSGKSNVIDSMLFVFGFRAQKIRSKKVSVLIHNSENHKNISSCTVEVHFEKIIDEENGTYASVPDSKFFVARSAYKDNSSQYFINQKKVHFKEVSRLLENSGIDLNHNRFLILQGEVEQISLMKPMAAKEHGGEGMLEYLEDIIGTNRYKDAIEKIHVGIETLEEQRKEKLARVKLVEKEKERWEPLFAEAVAYLKKQNEKVRLESVLHQHELNSLRIVEERSKESLKKWNEESEVIENEVKEAKAEKRKVSKEISDLEKKLEKNSKAYECVQSAFRSLEKMNVKIFEDRKHKKNKLKTLEKKLEKDKVKLKELAKEPETLEKTVEELTKEQKELNDDRKEAEETLHKKIVSFKEESKVMQDQKEKLVQELLGKTDEVNSAKEKVDLSKVEYEIFESTYKKATEAVTECEKEIEERSSSLEWGSNRSKEIVSLTEKLTQSVNSTAKKIGELNKKKKHFQEKGKKLHSSLTEIRFARQNVQSRGAVHNFLQEKKRSGEIPGIHGRLGDLGAIDEKYDVAISSCCSALEHYVVDTVDSAKACVQALKEQNVGRTTFIIMEKMREYEAQANQVPDVPLKRLVDLVRPRDEQYRTAFFYGLRNTLVADDLKSATKVAYGKNRRWRVVTLKGEVIDTAGTMSGGGNKVMRGRMGSNCPKDDVASEAEIQNLEEQYKKLESDLYKIQEELDTLEDSLTNEGRELEKLRSESSRVKANVDNDREMIASLKEKLPTLREALKLAKPDKNQEKILRKEIDDLVKVYNKAFEKANVVQKKIEKIDTDIEKLRKKKIQPQEEYLADVKENIEKVSGHISKNKVAIKTSQRNYQKTETSIANGEKDLEKGKEEVVQLEEDYKSLETKGQDVLTDLKNLEDEGKELTAQNKMLYKQAEEMEKKESEVNQKLKVIKKRSAEDLRNAQIASEKIKTAKQMLANLALNAIDGETVAPIKKLTAEELEEEFDSEELQTKIALLENQSKQMNPDLRAIAEFKKKQHVYMERVEELTATTNKREEYRKIHENLRKRRLSEFSEGFAIITNKLKENYQMITLGGDAELEFVDSLDPFSEGVAFSVRPPKKSWKNIRNLSGGEKTLSSLALIFALHHYRPTPLYVMDEIDAALDVKNVTIIARYIVERTKDAQFIVISLRNNMFESANRLVGIYKTDNCTKCATIQCS